MFLSKHEANREATKDTNRLEAFSDGVFAIGITLLVLNIHIPAVAANNPGGLRRALLEQWPVYLAYVLSFLTVLNMWVNHHNIFKYIKRTDHWFLFINGFLLMGITLVPFPTALLAQYFGTPSERVAMVVYGGFFIWIGVGYNLLWFYSSNHMRLMDRRLNPEAIRKISRRYLITPPLFIVAFVIAFFNAPISLLIYVLLLLMYMLPGSSLPDPATALLAEPLA